MQFDTVHEKFQHEGTFFWTSGHPNFLYDAVSIIQKFI